MTAQRSYYVSAKAIVIENRNNGLRNRKLDFRYTTAPAVSSPTPFRPTAGQCETADHVWKYVHKLIKKRLVLCIKTISFANITARKTEICVFDIL